MPNQAEVGLWLLPVGLHYWAVHGSTYQDDVLRKVGKTASRGMEMVRDRDHKRTGIRSGVEQARD